MERKIRKLIELLTHQLKNNLTINIENDINKLIIKLENNSYKVKLFYIDYSISFISLLLIIQNLNKAQKKNKLLIKFVKKRLIFLNVIRMKLISMTKKKKIHPII